MQTCKPECVTSIPSIDFINGCKLTTRDGGIPRLTFLVCDPNLTLPEPPAPGQTDPWTNLDNVKWAICNGYLFITGNLVGQKPKGTTTKRRLSSCGPEETIAGQKTLTFTDFNADKETLIDYDFWQQILDNRKFLYFGFIACDDRWYQYPGKWDLEVDEVIEDNSESGLSFYDGTVVMSTKDIIKPILVPGLLTFLAGFKSADCYS